MDMSILVETIKIELLMCNHNMCQIPIKLGDSLKIHGLHSCLLSEGVTIVLQNWVINTDQIGFFSYSHCEEIDLFAKFNV
jgi:hypothetical protein